MALVTRRPKTHDPQRRSVRFPKTSAVQATFDGHFWTSPERAIHDEGFWLPNGLHSWSFFSLGNASWYDATPAQAPPWPIEKGPELPGLCAWGLGSLVLRARWMQGQVPGVSTIRVNRKLLGTSASLLVTSALLVATRSYKKQEATSEQARDEFCCSRAVSLLF